MFLPIALIAPEKQELELQARTHQSHPRDSLGQKQVQSVGLLQPSLKIYQGGTTQNDYFQDMIFIYSVKLY